MLKEERLRRMLGILDEQGMITAEELSRMFYVSLPTIYRDLRELARRRQIVHSEGRIQRVQDQTVAAPLDYRRSIHTEEKAAIAREAVQLIAPGSSIFIDASSTAAHLIDYLKPEDDLTVLTNGIVTAMLLKQAGIRVFCVGGALIENSFAVGGRIGTEMINRFSIDTMLFSAHGVNQQGIIIDPSEEETSLRRHILKRTKASVFLCDGSKFGRSSTFNIAPLQEVDYLVTDSLEAWNAPVKRRVILAK